MREPPEMAFAMGTHSWPLFLHGQLTLATATMGDACKPPGPKTWKSYFIFRLFEDNTPGTRGGSHTFGILADARSNPEADNMPGG